MARIHNLALALVGMLSLLAACAKAQIDKGCVDAATLWIPSNSSIEKVVVKWSKPIKYDIIAPQGEVPEIVHTIEDTLGFLAIRSGLRIEPGQNPDLVIAVAHNISTAAPDFRKFAQDFLQQGLSAADQRRGSTEIDPAQWEAKFRSTSPKCEGIDIFRNGTILRAFALIQSDEGVDCVNVVSGEVFGLINIKAYYIDHERKVPADFIAAGIRALYDKRVIAGSSAVEANKIAGEVCKWG
jgi:hypothetical protein